MTNNQHLAVASVIGMALTCFTLYIAWDGDGFWLRQALLIFTGFTARTVLNIIARIEE